MNIIMKGQKDLERKLKNIQAAVKRAEIRSINKTAVKTRTQAAKLIGQEVTLKASYIKNKLKVVKANKNKEYAIVFATRRGVLLSRYSNRQLTKKAKSGGRKNAGISVKVGRKSPRKKMKGAFYLRLKNSGVMGIAVRHRGAKGRDNYEVIHAPSVSQVWNNILVGMKQDVETWWYDIARSELKYEFRKIGMPV